ncbi:MAG: single-stranded DNA-binding protein [Candidatus Omnitrophica bacterium]|nr:single-stranded DNA-binding protein [Candidatus Omnitrophota bacterium]
MINRIVLVGRLVADPEVRYTQNGVAVSSFSIAVDRPYRSAGGERQTDFINIVAWRKLAELMGQYMKKGRLIGVDGSLQMRKYQTKEGENRTVYEVQADNIQFLDRGESSGSGSAGAPPAPSDENAPPDFPNSTPSESESGEDYGQLPF